MEVLNKTIKKLTEEEYQQLIQEVSGTRQNKPFMVLEVARKENKEDAEVMAMLNVNPSAYYTLKSRLNAKIAAMLSKKVQNPIQSIMDEVSRVPAHLFGNNKEFSIRALTELEKQLIEYDLNAELIVVYKTLAQLHLFSEHYPYYESKLNRHIAFSLAVSKAENMFFQFLKKLGEYQLTMSESDVEEVIMMKRELSNICELYDSHRLFVLFNIARIYYLCNVPNKMDGLKSRELEIEAILTRMSRIFENYPLDTFYQNIKGITDLLYFEYYQRTNNQVRAEFYLQKINEAMPAMLDKHIMHFFIVQFMRSKVLKFLQDGNLDSLTLYHERFENNLDIPSCDTYHYAWWMKYLSIVKFYQNDFHAAAKKMNELRNELSMKQYVYIDIDNKLFQAFQYCIMGDDSLCMQIMSSLKRQIHEQPDQYESARMMMKLLKSALKPADYRKKIQKISDLWSDFEKQNNSSSKPVLTYVKMDDNILRKLSNPIKS